MQNLKKIILISSFLVILLNARAQETSVIISYIKAYKELAIEEMQRTGVPASIKLAQGIHETMAGTSILVQKSNNHFGIKCKTNWTGAWVSHDDDARGECFRKYTTAEKSYRDHSDFLRGSERYAFLFNLDPTDYAAWAKGLKKAGYATNPRYPQIIIKLIEDYHLQDYTMIALGKKIDDPLKEVIAVSASNAMVKPESVIDFKPETIMEAVKRVVPDYPETEFQINETRVIYAKKGTSFLAIAEQYSVPLARLFEFNELANAENLEADQLIYLQRKRKTGNNNHHIVKEGESLHDIAQAEAIRLESLLEYNFLQKNMNPAPGEKLYLREKAPSVPQLATNKGGLSPNGMMAYGNISNKETGISTGSLITCTVQQKETIYSIAKKYNVKIDDIVRWNQLEGYDLKTGQLLKIYK